MSSPRIVGRLFTDGKPTQRNQVCLDVGIHRKSGCTPIVLIFDFETKSVPLDATLIKVSHGLNPDGSAEQQGVLLSSQAMPRLGKTPSD